MIFTKRIFSLLAIFLMSVGCKNLYAAGHDENRLFGEEGYNPYSLTHSEIPRQRSIQNDNRYNTQYYYNPTMGSPPSMPPQMIIQNGNTYNFPYNPYEGFFPVGTFSAVNGYTMLPPDSYWRHNFRINSHITQNFTDIPQQNNLSQQESSQEYLPESVTLSLGKQYEKTCIIKQDFLDAIESMAGKNHSTRRWRITKGGCIQLVDKLKEWSGSAEDKIVVCHNFIGRLIENSGNVAADRLSSISMFFFNYMRDLSRQTSYSYPVITITLRESSSYWKSKRENFRKTLEKNGFVVTHKYSQYYLTSVMFKGAKDWF